MSQFLVDFVNSADRESIDTYFAANNCTVIKEYSKFDKVFLVSADSEPLKTELVESVVADSEAPLTLLEKEFITYPTYDDKNWWKLASTNILDFTTENISHVLPENKVNVYVVDSGCDLTHPEFQGRDVEFIFSYDGINDDTRGHGTAMASVIGGNTCALTHMPIKVVKIFGGRPTLQSDLLNAFEAIIEHNATSPYYGVVNLSWTIPKNTYVESKIKDLIDSGVPVVCSAGNNGVPIENVTPASMPEVVTVGSYNQDFSPCDFSNYTGSPISVTNSEVNTGALDVWAPGEKIWVATLNGGYGLSYGTSISSAIHASAVAYFLSDLLINDDALVNQFYAVSQNLFNMINGNSTVSLFNRDMLDLSDKYSNSINRITRFHSQMGSALTNAHLNFVDRRVVFYNGYYRIQKIFLPRYVRSYNVVEGSFPDWANIEHGYVRGTPNLNLTEPQTYEFTLEFTTTDPEFSPRLRVTLGVYPDSEAPEVVKDPTIIISPTAGNPQCTDINTICFDCTNIGDACLDYPGCGLKGNQCFCGTECP